MTTLEEMFIDRKTTADDGENIPTANEQVDIDDSEIIFDETMTNSSELRISKEIELLDAKKELISKMKEMI